MTFDDADDFDGMAPSLPGSTPDEDAWESYLVSALDQLGANGSLGLRNAELAELEKLLGHQLPFEIGMLMIMGVPDDDVWFDWRSDPAATLASWERLLLDGLRFDIEHSGFWTTALGPRPEAVPVQLDQATIAFPTLPRLFPLWGRRAVPLTPAIGEASNDFNPVLSVLGTNVIVYGTDLAAAMHAEFGVPLPPWPEPAPRTFPFWTELSELTE